RLGLEGASAASAEVRADMRHGRSVTLLLVGPADRRVMPVLSRIIPTHSVIGERATRRSDGERQLVGTNRMTGVRPHLSAWMHGRQLIVGHVQDTRDFRGTLFALDSIGDRHLLRPQVL